jgi:hypothetical protein
MPFVILSVPIHVVDELRPLPLLATARPINGSRIMYNSNSIECREKMSFEFRAKHGSARVCKMPVWFCSAIRSLGELQNIIKDQFN